MESTMPHNADFERAILASCFTFEDDRATILQELKPRDFYNTAHREIFQAINNVDHNGLAPEVSVLVAEIEGRGKSIDLMLINEILNREPTAGNVKHYVKTLKDLSLKRRMAEIGNAIFKKALNGSVLSGQEIYDGAMQDFINLGSLDTHENESLSNTVSRIVCDIEDNATPEGKIPGIKTGFYDLDEMIGGLKPCNLYVIAARPSRGKSALAGNIAVNAAMEGVRVQIFSMEMSREQLAIRWLAAKSKINLKRIEHYKLTEDERVRITEAGTNLSELGINNHDRGGLSNLDLERLSRQFKAQNDTGLVIVDYLQLASGQHPKNSVKDAGDVSKSLKRIAQSLRIPVIGISQLNRDAGKHYMPKLYHLRESGDIEQDADAVIMISSWDEKEKPGIRELAVVKQRQGPKGSIKLYWAGEFTQFLNLHEE